MEEPGVLGGGWVGTRATLKEITPSGSGGTPLLISELFTGAVRGNNGTVSELSKEASYQDIKAQKDAFSFAGSSDRAVNRFCGSSSRVDLLCVCVCVIFYVLKSQHCPHCTAPQKKEF